NCSLQEEVDVLAVAGIRSIQLVSRGRASSNEFRSRVKVRLRATRKPARETRALPGSLDSPDYNNAERAVISSDRRSFAVFQCRSDFPSSRGSARSTFFPRRF